MHIQPLYSRSCGQFSVANLLNIKPEKSISVFGKLGVTNTKDVSKALKTFGCECPDRLIKITKNTVLPDLCILKITWHGKLAGSHWVVYRKGRIMCSVYGFWNFKYYFKQQWKGKATSYLPVKIGNGVL